MNDAVTGFDTVEPADVGIAGDRLAFADKLMQEQFDTGRSPMLAAVVAREGKVFYTNTIGDQRPGGPPLTLESVFPQSSNGKPMTAATLLALAERGKVAINHPVSEYIPELQADEIASLLVHHLLTHTSGWDDGDLEASRVASFDAVVAEPSDNRDLVTHVLLATGLRVPRRYDPGELMVYTNFNYTLIGEIIRLVTGDTLDAAMRRYVFEAVGMQSSAVIVPDEMVPRVVERPRDIPHAPGHAESPIAFYDPLWFACDDGGAGVHSTPLDNLRFLEMVRNGGVVGTERVLSPASIRLMTTNQIPGVRAIIGPEPLREASWGYGFGVGGASPLLKFRGGLPSRGTLRHGGSGGVTCWVDLDLGISGVYYEVITEENNIGMPLSWAAHRFEDIITAAVID